MLRGKTYAELAKLAYKNFKDKEIKPKIEDDEEDKDDEEEPPIKFEETEFKSDHIKRLSKQAPYVVFIDDSTKYIQHVLDQSINNCFVINTPLGVIDFKPNNDHAFVIKRYPHNLQAMLPLLDAFRSVIHI